MAVGSVLSRNTQDIPDSAQHLITEPPIFPGYLPISFRFPRFPKRQARVSVYWALAHSFTPGSGHWWRIYVGIIGWPNFPTAANQPMNSKIFHKFARFTTALSAWHFPPAQRPKLLERDDIGRPEPAKPPRHAAVVSWRRSSSGKTISAGYLVGIFIVFGWRRGII